MRVIPVIDLVDGLVVRAIAGRANEYQPVESRLTPDAHPTTVACALVQEFEFDTAYVADIDAIRGGPPNVEAWKAIHGAGLRLCLDAGIGTPQALSALHKLLSAASIDAEIVIALESLESAPDSEDWRNALAQAPACTFSLDLKNGIPNHRLAQWKARSAVEIARSAHACGFREMIVLDLADVGMNGGTRTRQLCEQLQRELSPVSIIAGGGVRGFDDLRALAAAGCSAALVASALHDGRLTRDDIRMANQLPH